MATQSTIHVGLSNNRDYDIHIGETNIGTACATVARSKRCVIVSQPRIAGLYAEGLQASLKKAGFTVLGTVCFPDGEEAKHLETLTSLCESFYSLPEPLDRKTLVIALGGGVVGDVAGFLAAIYLRGLDFVQIPTTLLAMVDSSVGGKTGVDLKSGKNLVGAFHQPRLVVANLATLQTLPERDFLSGLAEIVKYGVIADPELFVFMQAKSDAVLQRDPDTLTHLITRSCKIKADVVVADEHETTGLRAILNFGHTIGHALEGATHYSRYLHGEAIAIGMISACCIGEAFGITPLSLRPELTALLTDLGLPVALPKDISDADLIALTAQDKKAVAGEARFVLASAMGKVALQDKIPREVVLSGLQKHREATQKHGEAIQ
jgi:3-dehydroquinate synthase